MKWWKYSGCCSSTGGFCDAVVQVIKLNWDIPFCNISQKIDRNNYMAVWLKKKKKLTKDFKRTGKII